MYLEASAIKAKHFDVASITLRRWALSGKIECIRGNRGRLYSIESIRKYLASRSVKGGAEKDGKEKTICYARVSSEHQRHDLERQVQDLKQRYPKSHIITDIASGINFNRAGLKTLLERCRSGNVEEVVVAHKDRLARFGFDLLSWIFQTFAVRLVVLYDHSHGHDEQELADDLLAITTVFVARNNGLRSAANRKRRRDQLLRDNGDNRTQEEKEEVLSASGKSSSIQDRCDERAAKKAKTMDGMCKKDLQRVC